MASGCINEVEASARGRPQVLHEHIGAGEQGVHDLLAGGVTEVEGHPALALVHGQEGQRVGPVGVTAGPFDPDDVGAEVREHRRRQRGGEEGRDVEHPQPVQRQ
jgi:hypothetical protein